jgi:hypothetical protein
VRLDERQRLVEENPRISACELEDDTRDRQHEIRALSLSDLEGSSDGGGAARQPRAGSLEGRFGDDVECGHWQTPNGADAFATSTRSDALQVGLCVREVAHVLLARNQAAERVDLARKHLLSTGGPGVEPKPEPFGAESEVLGVVRTTRDPTARGRVQRAGCEFLEHRLQRRDCSFELKRRLSVRWRSTSRGAHRATTLRNSARGELRGFAQSSEQLGLEPDACVEHPRDALTAQRSGIESSARAATPAVEDAPQLLVCARERCDVFTK